jgi:hypothetical protein
MKQQKQLMEMNALALGGAPINPLAMQMQMQVGSPLPGAAHIPGYHAGLISFY